MQKPNEWVCSSGCTMADGRPCEHLEKLLPQMLDGDHPQYLSDGAIGSMTMNVFQAYLPQFSESEFVAKMRSYGFVDEWDLELLTAKYYYGMSLRRISAEFNWCSFSTVRWKLKRLHALLKERGFKHGSVK